MRKEAVLVPHEEFSATQFMIDLISKHKITPPEIIDMDIIDIKDAFIEGESRLHEELDVRYRTYQ